MLRKMPRTNKKYRTLKEHGRILLRKIFQKLIECIKSIKQIRRIIIRSFRKIV